MPEMYQRKQGLVYTGCVPFAKYRETIKKFEVQKFKN